MKSVDHEAIIVGAGICGIYQLYRLLEMGIDCTVLEAESGPGGTWQRNRYPGARFDSESWSYGFSFSEELLEEWEWSEHFAAQPETLRYVEHVVEKFELGKHMQFNVTVERAVYDEDGRCWSLELADGRNLSCRFLMTAIGLLSAPTMPKIEGTDLFEGESFHTFHWPDEGIDLAGKRVAVVGTGATGVQVISEIADKVGELTVFQRRPNWCAPLHNSLISTEEQVAIKARYAEVFDDCALSPGGFIHRPIRTKMFEATEEERLAFWEELYSSPGFGVWLGNYRDMLTNELANAEFTSFIADKIRERVNDPALAEKLIPKDHGFGTRRVPMETRYYEAYNRANVHLVDIVETPNEAVTASGIATSDTHREFDVIVYATGFDAITGAFDRIEFVGIDGVTLREKWADNPVNYLGVQAAGFPNLIMVNGPTAGSATSNFPRGIEASVDWTTELMRHVWNKGVTRVEASEAAEQEWTAHIKDMYKMLLVNQSASWMNGYNSNVAGHENKVRYVIYAGGLPRYREELETVAGEGYAAFAMD
jgi:cation diffusion facilitator CzcD-associated flavoprotein CzcO